jgi:hypothetical protein
MPVIEALEYVQGASLPDSTLTCTDRDSVAANLASGYSFQLFVKDQSDRLRFAKNTGLTGTGSGVLVTWEVSGELAALPVGTYRLVVAATRTSDSKVRKFSGTVIISPG